MSCNLVLVNPQIPNNTGAIGRLCVNAGASLHIIKPIAFDIDEKAVRRAGLDYWKKLDLHVWESIEDFFKKVRAQVREQTNNQQIPWESTSLEGDFYFQQDANYVAVITQNEETRISSDNTNEINRNTAPEIKSLAILPFANYSGNETQAYL